MMPAEAPEHGRQAIPCPPSRRAALGMAGAALGAMLASRAAWACAPSADSTARASVNMFETGTIDLARARYAYRAVGKGATILFLHGLFASPRLFDVQMLALAATHRCVSIALPPHAGSRILSDGLGINDIADDVATLAARLGGSRTATLVGNSMGGAVALRTALRHPQAIDRLAVIASHGGALDPAFGAGIRQLSHAGADVRRRMIGQIMTAMYPAAWMAKNSGEFERQVDEAASIPPDQLDRLGEILSDYDDVGTRLSTLAMPVLLLWGEQDGIVNVEMAPRIASGFRSARLEIIAGAGHQPQVDRPEAVTEALVRFIGVP